MVNDPSPRVLRRVGAALDIPYARLMQNAGYLEGIDPVDLGVEEVQDTKA